jgi:hypothetical protein
MGILHPAGLHDPYAESFDGVLRAARNAANRPIPDIPLASPENRGLTLI